MRLSIGAPLAALALCAMTAPGLAQETEADTGGFALLEDAILGGDFSVRFRYRYHFLDIEGFEDQAFASTLQTLAKFETKPIFGVSLVGEGRNVTHVGDDLFNDTLNGEVTRPVIADPDVTEIDQAHIKFQDIIPDTVVTAGRRKIALNNQRFISTLPFRQNSNSFDGVVIENRSLPRTFLHYSYTFNFNRAFTDESPVGNFEEGSIQLFHGEHTLNEALTLVGYAYLLDIEDESFTFGPTDQGAGFFASNTFGGNAKGGFDLPGDFKAHYDFEYARQTDAEDSPAEFGLNYYRVVPGASFGPLRVNLGLEVLEGNGEVAVQTPLALLHAFNGFADVFVVTPPDGLRDAFVDATLSFTQDTGVTVGGYDLLKGLSVKLAYHEFEAEDTGVDFGREFDALIRKRINDNITVLAEFAYFDTDFDGPITAASPSFNRDFVQALTTVVVGF